jgi:hypothetical protein
MGRDASHRDLGDKLCTHIITVSEAVMIEAITAYVIGPDIFNVVSVRSTILRPHGSNAKASFNTRHKGAPTTLVTSHQTLFRDAGIRTLES